MSDSGGREGHVFRRHRRTTVTAGQSVSVTAELITLISPETEATECFSPIICSFLFYESFVMAADRFSFVCTTVVTCIIHFHWTLKIMCIFAGPVLFFKTNCCTNVKRKVKCSG